MKSPVKNAGSRTSAMCGRMLSCTALTVGAMASTASGSIGLMSVGRKIARPRMPMQTAPLRASVVHVTATSVPLLISFSDLIEMKRTKT